MITIEVINKYQDVFKLKDVWNQLNERGPDEVSLSFEWIVSLWESHLNKEDAMVLLFRKEDRLVGIAPLYTEKIRTGVIPMTRIGLMSNLYCTHNDLIISEDKQDCLEAMFRYFDKKRIKWDLFNFSDFINTSSSVDTIKDLSKKYGFVIKEIESDSSPYLPIKGSFEEFLAKKKRTKRRILIGGVENIQLLGKVEVKTYCGDGPLEPVIDNIFKIERKSWKEKDKSSITSSYSQMEFYRLFSEKIKAKKWIYITFLELNGEAIAYFYSIKYKNRLLNLKGSYVESYKDCVPGKVLYCNLIRDIHGSGIKEFDFLGKAEFLKMTWTNLTRDHKNYVIYNKKLHIYLYLKAQRIYDVLRKIRNNDIESVLKKIKNKCLYYLFHKIEKILYVKELDAEVKVIKLKNDICKLSKLSIEVITKYDEDMFKAVKRMRSDEDRKKYLSRFRRKDICFILKTSESEVVHVSWICYKEIYTINVKMKTNLYLEEKEFFIHDCFTNETCRGKLVYQYMLMHMLKYHKDRGFKRAFIDVESFNLPSIKGIDNTGFKRTKMFTLYTLGTYFAFRKEKTFNGNISRINYLTICPEKETLLT